MVSLWVILLYIFNLMYSPMSMYYQIKMGVFLIETENRDVTGYLEQEVLEELQEEYGKYLKGTEMRT